MGSVINEMNVCTVLPQQTKDIKFLDIILLYCVQSVYCSFVSLYFRPADQIISNRFGSLAQNLFPEALSSCISFITKCCIHFIGSFVRKIHDFPVFSCAPQSLLYVPVFTMVVITQRSCFVTFGHRLVPTRGEFGTGQAERQFWLDLCTAAASD